MGEVNPKLFPLTTELDGTEKIVTYDVGWRNIELSTLAAWLDSTLLIPGSAIEAAIAARVLRDGDLGTPTTGDLTNCTFPTLNQNTTGTAANLSGTPTLPAGTNLANCTFPTLNQNTTGTAANLSGTPTLPAGTNLANCTFPTLNQNTTGTAAKADSFLAHGTYRIAAENPAVNQIPVIDASGSLIVPGLLAAGGATGKVNWTGDAMYPAALTQAITIYGDGNGSSKINICGQDYAPSPGIVSIGTGGLERLRITIGGAVFIGATATAGDGNAPLEITGNPLISSGGETRIDVKTTGAGTAAAPLWLSHIFRAYDNSFRVSIEAGDQSQSQSGGIFRIRTMSSGGVPTENLRIVGGNVGIGTTAPLATLHVQGNSLTTQNGAPTATQLNMSNWAYSGSILATMGEGFPGLAIGGSLSNRAVIGTVSFHNLCVNEGLAATAGASIVAIGDTATATDFGQHLEFYTRQTGQLMPVMPRLRIASSGNVLVNTTTDLGTKFTVGGNGNFGFINCEANRTVVGSYNLGLTDVLAFNTAGVERMRLTASGNFLIGTTTGVGDLAAKVQVAGDISSTGSLRVGTAATTNDAYAKFGLSRTGDGTAYIDLIGDTTYTSYGLRLIRNAGANGAAYLTSRGTGGVTIRVVEAGHIALETTSLERMRITAGGNVVIGSTATVGAKFFIENTDYGRHILLGAAAQTSRRYSLGIPDSAAFEIYDHTDNASRLRITAGGNVLIGTATDAGYGLTINKAGGAASLSLSQDNSTSLLFTGDATSATIRTIGSKPLIFMTDNTEMARITAGGNVLIGTTTTKTTTATHLNVASAFILSNLDAVNGMNIGQNCYYNGGWKYGAAGKASLYYQNAPDGHVFNVAATGSADAALSFTAAMTINHNGNVLIGTTTDYGATLTVAAATAIIEARSTGTTGVPALIVMDNTASTGGKRREWYQGNSGVGALGLYNRTDGRTELQVTAAGNLVIGTTGDGGDKLQVYGTTGYVSVDSTSSNVGLKLRKAGVQYGLLGLSGAIEGGAGTEVGIFADTGRAIKFYTNGSGTAFATMTSSNQLLVNTTSALGDGTAKLQVAGNVITTGSIIGKTGVDSTNNTIPTVAGVAVLVIDNSTPITVTNFAGGTEGQIVTVLFNTANAVTVTRSNAYLAGGANFVSTQFDTLTLVLRSTVWHEVSRSVNS